MHTIWSRANAIFAFMLWVLTAVTFACFLTTVFLDPMTNAKIDIHDPKIRRVSDYASESGTSDVAQFDFSMNVDLTKVFNWNVKQIFLYLVAEYSTSQNPVNQVVVWDKIVLRGERVVIDERHARPEYYLLDDGSHLRSHKNVTFVLRYNVIPNAGYLALAQSQGQIQVEFPEKYSSGKA